MKTSKIDTKEEEYGYRLEDVAGWFEGCTSLQNFNGPAELVGAKVGLVTKDGCLFYNDGEKTRLLIYPWGRKNMDYTEDFANHYDGAFKYCSEIVAFNLKSGDFPVREMLNFPNLKSVTVEPSTRYKVIDDIVYEKDGQTKNVEPWCAIQSIECRLKRLRLRIVGFRMRSMENIQL